MSGETGYQPLEPPASPAVEMQAAQAVPAVTDTTASEQPKQVEAKPETKQAMKEEKVNVAVERTGYVPPVKPLRKFSRFAKAWVALSFPILLVHLGICLIYISQSYSFVASAFDNTANGMQYLITSVAKQESGGLEYDYDTGELTFGNPNFDCGSYNGSITTKGFIAASLSCATLLDWAAPMLVDFPARKGPKQRVEYPAFQHDASKFMSPELCITFTPFSDYDSYSYDYMLKAVADCQVANNIVPTNVQEWDSSKMKFKKDSVKRPKDKAIQMVYVYFFPMAAFVILLALYNYKYFIPWVNFVEPYSSAELIKVIFRGQLDGVFMASYQWNDHPTLDQTQMREPANQKHQGILPRKIATMLPHSWLDIENLIPGTQIKPACNNAARNARFTFGFISADYFKSANCGVEWTEIERRPGECILFAYPSTPQDKLDALAAQGHRIFKIPDVFDKMSPEWVLEHMISSRQANFLFAAKTPPINENWLSTLRYYFPTPDWQWLKYTIPLLLTYALLIVWHIAWSAHYNIFTLFKEGDIGTLGVLAFFLPNIGLSVTIYFMAMTYGTGFAHSELPDACLLLYFLKKLDIIPTIKFYTNCLEDADPGVKTLANLGIITFVDDIMEGDVRLINIDKLDDLPTPRNSDAIWASVGFMQLPQAVRDRIGSFIVGEKVPSCQLEFIAVKILMAAFQCPSTDSLDVGSNAFRQLKLKRVLE